MGWHCLRYLAPAREGIAFFRGLCFSSNNSTIFNLKSLVFLTINLVSQFILVDSERTCNRYVVGWHCLRYLAPTRESIAFFRGLCLSSDGSTVFNLWCLVFLTINHVNQFVLVDRESTSNSYIMGRHRLRYLAPTRESITFLRWFFLCSNSCSIFYFRSLVFLTINHVNQFVLVDRECTSNSYVMGRHRLRYFTPARERIAFLRGLCLSSNSCSDLNIMRHVFLIIHHISNGIVLGSLLGKIAWFTWSLVNTGIIIINMIRIVSCSFATNYFITTSEHVPFLFLFHIAHVPTFTCIDGCQLITISKHITHIRHVVRFEATNIKFR